MLCLSSSSRLAQACSHESSIVPREGTEAGETAQGNAKAATFKQLHIIIWGPVQTQRVGNRICCNERDIVDIFEKLFTGWLKVTEMHNIKQ